MIDSRTSRRLGLALAGAILALGPWGAPARAQQDVGPPIELFPPEPKPAIEAEPAPAPEAAPAPNTFDPSLFIEELPLDEAEEGGARIEVERLPEVDAQAASQPGAKLGGFGPMLWSGASRPLVEALLPRLPSESASRAVRDLARRLLLSSAPPPPGPAAVDFDRLRADGLVALGELEAAAGVLRATPGRSADPRLARLETEALLLAGEIERACARVRASLQLDDDPFWGKALIFCQIESGQHDAALLGLSLLHEMGEAEDRAFLALARLLTGEADELTVPLHGLTPLHFAMLRAAKLPITPNLIANMDPAVLAAAAFAEATPMALRLVAAERAEAFGLLTPERLGELYGKVEFEPDQLANPLSAAETLEGPRARALLYQVGSSHRVPIARAEALQKAWQLARGEGRYATAVRATLSAALELKPAPELGWFAADAVRAMIAVGRTDAAQGWLRLARQVATRSADAARAVLELWPLLQLSDPAMALDEDRLAAWWEDQSDVPEPQRRERASLLFSLFEALGISLPEVYWSRILPGPARVTTTVPATPVWQVLGRASADLRVGETVLLSLLVLGNGGPATASEPTLATVVSSLRSVGLEPEARALAVEAALAAGF